MNFFKALFGGKEETSEEKEQKNQEKNFEVLKYDGVRAQKIGELTYAIRCFNEALTIKEDPETVSYLAQAFIQTHELQQAYKTLIHLAELVPDNIQVYINLARVCETMKNYQETTEMCQKAFLIDDKCAEVYYLMAIANHGLEDDLSAIAMLTKAIVLQPDLAEAYMLRADILKQMRQLKDAEEDADYLLANFPITEEYYILKADLRLKQEDAPQAITYYNKVKEHNAFHQQAYIGLSEAYVANRQLDLALQLMNEAIELLPNFGEAYQERGRIKLLLNDKEGASEDLKKALELNPEAAKKMEGNFSNIEQEMLERYKNMNPYGF